MSDDATPGSSSSAVPRGAEITDAERLLLRVLREIWCEMGAVSAQNFRPAGQDQDLMSVDRGDKSSPAESFDRSVALRPVGVAGLTVAEVRGASLKAFDDPEDAPPNPAHAVVDFRNLKRKEQERRSKLLRARAAQRGCLHPSGFVLQFPC